MADAVNEAAPAASPAPAAAATRKKAKAAAKPKAPKAKGEKKVATHPKSTQMVIEAITKLAERKGSSLIAIKKVIADTHKVDVVKQGTNIKKALKKLVETGKLTQATGTGATGSFKLAVAPKPAKKATGEKKPKAVKAKKAASLKKVKMPAANKAAASPKKVAAAKPKTKMADAPATETAPAASPAPTAAATPKKAAAAKPKTAVAPRMEFNLMSKYRIYFECVPSSKRKKHVVSTTKTHDGGYYPTFDPVINKKPEVTDEEEDEATNEEEETTDEEEETTDEEEDDASDEDEDGNELREKSIDFLFGGDSDLAKNLKERVEVPLITELTLTSSNDGRMTIYTKLEDPEDKEGDLFEGLFKLQESLPPNSLELILSLNDFDFVGIDGYDNCCGYGSSDSSNDSEVSEVKDSLDFEKGLKLKRNKGGRVILETTDIHFPEDGSWWVKWIDGRTDFRGEVSLNVRLDLAAITELYQRQFKGDPLATEVNTATDLVILVEGNTDKAKGIKCNKSVLSGMSPVFLRMFQADMLEAREGTLKIPDFSEPVIRALIEFAYRGNVAEAVKSFEMTLELLKVADKYDMKDLMDVLLHLIRFMPCAWFEVDLAIELFIFAKNRGEDLDQAKEKAGIVLKWYATRDSMKLMNSKMLPDMYETPRLATKFVVQLLKKTKWNWK